VQTNVLPGPKTGVPGGVTVLLPVLNREELIRDCLESVKWADEILVVDSFSTDRTLEICREYTDRILQHEYVYSAKQKNWGLEQIQTEWVFHIDSDETVEPELRDEVLATLCQSEGVDGYRIRIKNLMWGKWVRGCGMYPCTQVRLFRTQKGRWSDRQVHARVQGMRCVRDLKHHIIHRDIDDLTAELNQFVSQVLNWEFIELVKRGKRWRWWDVTLRPLAIFLLFYFRYGGYREGFRGFYLSVYRGLYSFMTYARLYEDEVRRGLRR
jgi:glycosyltransferase involved in cell wall biosynthesis